MSVKSTNVSDSETAIPGKFNVPIQLMDSSMYDTAFASMKQRFAAETRRMDEEMAKFSKELLWLYGQTTSVQSGISPKENQATSWDVITKSPLLEGEGENKILKLQFDLSQFDPNEVTVQILNNMLIVSAAHQQKDGSSASYREFNREFLLPHGTDPEAVESSLTKDGILVVRAPVRLDAVKAATKEDIEEH